MSLEGINQELQYFYHKSERLGKTVGLAWLLSRRRNHLDKLSSLPLKRATSYLNMFLLDKDGLDLLPRRNKILADMKLVS